MLLDEKIQLLQKETKRKITYEEVADVLGLGSKQAAYNRVTRKTPLKDWEIVKLDDRFKDVSIKDNDCITIDHIHINPSCGSGTVVLAEADVTPVKIGREIIKNIWNSKPEDLKIFKASGDSMEETITDNDLLLIDISKTDYKNGGIFLLTVDNDWYIKRLRLRITGELDIISDNPHYSIETLKQDTTHEIKVIGRVIKNLSKGL